MSVHLCESCGTYWQGIHSCAGLLDRNHQVPANQTWPDDWEDTWSGPEYDLTEADLFDIEEEEEK